MFFATIVTKQPVAGSEQMAAPAARPVQVRIQRLAQYIVAEYSERRERALQRGIFKYCLIFGLVQVLLSVLFFQSSSSKFRITTSSEVPEKGAGLEESP
jgi:hypothetical protein